MADIPQASSSREILTPRIGLWLLMVSVALLFGVLGLAFLTARPVGEPLYIPPVFYLSTVILALSSAAGHRAMSLPGQAAGQRWLGGTLVLAGVFLVLQATGWYQMVAAGLPLTGSRPQVSYLYLLTGLHAVHLLGGMGFLGYVRARYRKKSIHTLENAIFFWHFLGILWVYLLVLLLMGS
ncbi:MAG: cytochrome c oxidase subunit 3 [Bacteroidia bacterium]|nr:cytochrome c oxidase subunit 3 [Bacteroidia bacterium]